MAHAAPSANSTHNSGPDVPRLSRWATRPFFSAIVSIGLAALISLLLFMGLGNCYAAWGKWFFLAWWREGTRWPSFFLSSAFFASGHGGKKQGHSAKSPIEAVFALVPIHHCKSSACGQLSAERPIAHAGYYPAGVLPCTLVTVPWSRFQIASHCEGQLHKCLIGFCSAVGEWWGGACSQCWLNAWPRPLRSRRSCLVWPPPTNLLCQCRTAGFEIIGSSGIVGSHSSEWVNYTARLECSVGGCDRFPAAGKMKRPSRRVRRNCICGVMCSCPNVTPTNSSTTWLDYQQNQSTVAPYCKIFCKVPYIPFSHK